MAHQMLSIVLRFSSDRRYNTGEDFNAEESRTEMRYGRPKVDILLPDRMTNYVSSQSKISFCSKDAGKSRYRNLVRIACPHRGQELVVRCS